MNVNGGSAVSDLNRLREATTAYLNTSPHPVFLCSVDRRTRPTVTAHVASRSEGRRLRRGLDKAIGAAGIDARCRVRVHRERDLQRTRSLEEFIWRFGYDWFLYDPTGCVHRSRKIVASARFAGGLLGKRLTGVYFEPARRVVHVVLDRDAISRLGEDPEILMREVGPKIARHLDANLQGTGFGLELALSFVVPPLPLVPVTAGTQGAGKLGRVWRSRVNRRALIAAMSAAVGLGASSAAFAESNGLPLPAVSGINGKAGVTGGIADGDGLFFGDASIAVPMPFFPAFGVQVDATLGDFGKHTVFGFGGHVFWRNPALGLVGVTGSYAEINDSRHSHIARIGGEVEGYMGDILGVGGDLTIRAGGGWQDGEKRRVNIGGPGGRVTTRGPASLDGGYGSLMLAYYPIDDLVLKLGGEVASGPKNNVGTFGLQYQPAPKAFPGLTVFVDGAVGEDHYEGVFGGLRYYFGRRPKSLKRRHREDDPTGLVPNFPGLQGAGEGKGYPADGAALPCWVAREVYGVDNPDWLRFRSWLLTKAPAPFRALYIAHGERFARWISDKPRVKTLIRAWMDRRLQTAI